MSENKESKGKWMGNLLAGLANTGLSLIRDKKANSSAVTNSIQGDLEEGVSISSKRVLNLAGTVGIITLALASMGGEDGITKMNLLVLAIGVAYALGMSFITAYSENK